MTTVTMTSSDAANAQFANSVIRLVSNKRALISVLQEVESENGTEMVSCFAINVAADDGSSQTVRIPGNTFIVTNSTITITKL